MLNKELDYKQANLFMENKDLRSIPSIMQNRMVKDLQAKIDEVPVDRDGSTASMAFERLARALAQVDAPYTVDFLQVRDSRSRALTWNIGQRVNAAELTIDPVEHDRLALCRPLVV